MPCIQDAFDNISNRIKPKHKRLPLEKVKHYVRLYGSNGVSYLHLNSALYHYEVS